MKNAAQLSSKPTYITGIGSAIFIRRLYQYFIRVQAQKQHSERQSHTPQDGGRFTATKHFNDRKYTAGDEAHTHAKNEITEENCLIHIVLKEEPSDNGGKDCYRDIDNKTTHAADDDLRNNQIAAMICSQQFVSDEPVTEVRTDKYTDKRCHCDSIHTHWQKDHSAQGHCIIHPGRLHDHKEYGKYQHSKQ